MQAMQPKAISKSNVYWQVLDAPSENKNTINTRFTSAFYYSTKRTHAIARAYRDS